jgi:hypothetical protein
MLAEASPYFGAIFVILLRSSASSFLFFLFAFPNAFGCAVQAATDAEVPGRSVTRAYSSIDDVRANKNRLCQIISRSGDNENPALNERCPPGPRGWPVTMFSADARVYVSFGRQTNAGATVMEALDGAFADPYSVIEWRLRDGEPFAAIHRYFLDGKQVLTVHRLNRDRTSCVAAVVAVERGHDANAEAIQIADDIVPSFRCGDDQLITTARTQSPALRD